MQHSKRGNMISWDPLLRNQIDLTDTGLAKDVCIRRGTSKRCQMLIVFLRKILVKVLVLSEPGHHLKLKCKVLTFEPCIWRVCIKIRVVCTYVHMLLLNKDRGHIAHCSASKRSFKFKIWAINVGRPIHRPNSKTSERICQKRLELSRLTPAKFFSIQGDFTRKYPANRICAIGPGEKNNEKKPHT